MSWLLPAIGAAAKVAGTAALTGAKALGGAALTGAKTLGSGILSAAKGMIGGGGGVAGGGSSLAQKAAQALIPGASKAAMGSAAQSLSSAASGAATGAAKGLNFLKAAKALAQSYLDQNKTTAGKQAAQELAQPSIIGGEEPIVTPQTPQFRQMPSYGALIAQMLQARRGF